MLPLQIGDFTPAAPVVLAPTLIATWTVDGDPGRRLVPAGGDSPEELATKLELAVAYDEIGDKDGARELLQEVLRAGDASQKARAQELLGKLG